MTVIYVIILSFVSIPAAALLLAVIVASAIASTAMRHRGVALMGLGGAWLSYAAGLAIYAPRITLSDVSYVMRGEPLLPTLIGVGWIALALAVKRPVRVAPVPCVALIAAALAQFAFVHPVTLLQTLDALPHRYLDYPEYFDRIAMIEQVSAVIFVFGVGLFLAGWSRSVRLRQP